MEQKNKILIVVAFIVFAAVFVFVASRREYKINGNNVYVKTPQAITTLQKSGEFSQNVYLLVGEGLNENDYYHTELPVISMGTVEDLTKKYGDFRNCANAGAQIGRENIVGLRLIGTDEVVVKKIAAIYDQSRRREDRIVRIDGAPLQIIEHKVRSNRARNLFSLSQVENLLVRDIEMVKILE